MDSYKDNSDDSSVVNTSSASRKAWLIKVPKYLSKSLERAKPMKEIGRIRITNNSSDSPQIVFNISKQLIEAKDEERDDSENESNIPIEHEFNISRLETQTICVFTESQDSKQISIVGNVAQKGECRPLVSTSYLNLNKERMRKASQTTRALKQLDRRVTVFMPITNRLIAPKKSLDKKCKQDKQTVRDMLFKAFERHQYYNMRSLETLTLQPLYYLKEIVREICNYNIKYPHKYMWELKPEFRHYSDNKENV